MDAEVICGDGEVVREAGVTMQRLATEAAKWGGMSNAPMILP